MVSLDTTADAPQELLAGARELIQVENFSKLDRFGFSGHHSQCNPFHMNIKTAPCLLLGLFPFPFPSAVMLPHRVLGPFHGVSEQL